MRLCALLMCLVCAPAGWSQQPALPPPIAPPAANAAPAAPRPPWIAQVGLNHYAQDNERLAAHPDRARVVLMGDSITDFWKGHDPSLFADGRFVNRGISGQTTPQMLLRFRADVIDLHPAAVVILAGVNDLAQNVGPESVEMIEGNLQSMAELAQASKIAVLFCSILPTDHFPWHPGLAPAPEIKVLNDWMRQYAADHRLGYIDYAAAMAGPDGTMPKSLAADDVHPTDAGYAVMRPMLEKSVAAVLKQQSR